MGDLRPHFFCGPNPCLSDFTAELSGDQIVVGQPGTQFQAAYIRLDGQPDLVLLAETVDPDAEREEQF
jgi:hypothetical protein